MQVGDRTYISKGSGGTDRCFLEVVKLNPKRFKGKHIHDEWHTGESLLYGEVRDYSYDIQRPQSLEDARNMLKVVERRTGELFEQRAWLQEWIIEHLGDPPTHKCTRCKFATTDPGWHHYECPECESPLEAI